jgi:hypothetical protein
MKKMRINKKSKMYIFLKDNNNKIKALRNQDQGKEFMRIDILI